MMRIPCTIAAVFLLALLAGQACADVERQQEENLVPIAFSAVVSGDMPLTRAAHEIGDDATLQANGFGVFACYTGLHKYSESDANASFMYDQKVEWSAANSHWVYEPLKYWPNGEGEATSVTGENPHYVSFFAYAPYSDGSNPCIPSYILEQEKGNPWIMYRLSDDPADQVDLLYAQPLLDQTKPQIGSKLEFTFKHALACVGENVTISSTATGTGFEVRLKEVKIDYTLTSKGRLVLWNRGAANWSVVQSEDVVTTRSLTLLSNGSASLPKTFEGNGIFCIPVEASGYPQKATIHVTYVVVYDDTSIAPVERSASKELSLKGLLQEGKKLDINVNLTNI
jgi:hypothetical protein